MSVLGHLFILAVLWINAICFVSDIQSKPYQVTILGKYTDQTQPDNTPSDKKKQSFEIRFPNNHIEKVPVSLPTYVDHQIGDTITYSASNTMVYGEMTHREVYAWISLILAVIVTIGYLCAMGGLEVIGELFEAFT